MPGWWIRRLRRLWSCFGGRRPKNQAMAELPVVPLKSEDAPLPRASPPPALDPSRRPLNSCDAYEPPW